MCLSWWCLTYFDVLHVIVLGEINVEGPWIFNVHICVVNTQVRFSKAPQEALKKESKGVETVPWKCQLTEPKDAPFVEWRTINGKESIKNYPGEILSQKTSQYP